jgi:hypothetical protein
MVVCIVPDGGKLFPLWRSLSELTYFPRVLASEFILPLRCHTISSFLQSLVRYYRQIIDHYMLILTVEILFILQVVQRLVCCYRWIQIHNILFLVTEMLL